MVMFDISFDKAGRGHDRLWSSMGLEEGGGVIWLMGPNVHIHSRGFLLFRVMGVEGQMSLSESSSEDESRLSPHAGDVGDLIGRAAAAAARLCFRCCCWT
jgi:hypothetical protein